MEHIQNFHKSKLPPRLPRLIFCLALAAAFSALQTAMAFDHSHKLLGTELHKFVGPSGVHYAKWKEKREGLDKYLESLGQISPEEYEKFDPQQKKTLWINAYNALAIKLVLDHYPIHSATPNERYPADSIRQIPNVWDAVSCKVAGREVTLYTIAHDILRRDTDCRTHFAIVPASKGGGILHNTPFEPKTVEHELDKVTHEYFAKPESLRCNFDDSSITVSQIFKWFPFDFISPSAAAQIPMPTENDVVKDYVFQFLPADAKKKFDGKNVRIIYGPYDWSLNDADNRATQTAIKSK